MTLLPLGAVNAAEIEQTGASYELLAFDGTSSTVGAVHADLLMLLRTFQAATGIAMSPQLVSIEAGAHAAIHPLKQD